MTILTDRLPESVEIDGREYEINSDYRVCLRIMEAFEDNELAPAEKQAVMLELLYPEMPEDIAAACTMGLKFLNCGEEAAGAAAEAPERLYSLTKDARYIFTGILQTHGIDVERIDKLHWWKFCYLFMDLREDCFFSKIIYYRTQHQKGKLTPEEREYYDANRSVFELPRSPEDTSIEDEFMRLLRGG